MSVETIIGTIRTVKGLSHYSSTVLLFGNQHVDHSLFSFCDSVQF